MDSSWVAAGKRFRLLPASGAEGRQEPQGRNVLPTPCRGGQAGDAAFAYRVR